MFASVMRSTVTIKKDDAATPTVTKASQVKEKKEAPRVESHSESSGGSTEKDSAVPDSSVVMPERPKETEPEVVREAADDVQAVTVADDVADEEVEQPTTVEPARAEQEVPEGFQSDPSQTYRK